MAGLVAFGAYASVPQEAVWQSCNVTGFNSTTIECQEFPTSTTSECERMVHTCDCGKRCTAVGWCVVLFVTPEDAADNSTHMLLQHKGVPNSCWKSEGSCRNGEDIANRLQEFKEAAQLGKDAVQAKTARCYERDGNLYAEEESYLGTVILLVILAFVCLVIGGCSLYI